MKQNRLKKIYSLKLLEIYQNYYCPRNDVYDVLKNLLFLLT